MPRGYTDAQLIDAIAAGTCWADVMDALGKKRRAPATHVQETAKRLGLDTTHLDHHRSNCTPVVRPEMPFTREAGTGRHDGRVGLAAAARWFLDRGYSVSIPLEPTLYDLITESDDGLKRIQVKTTCYTERGRYCVALTRSTYDPDRAPNSRGSFHAVPYEEGMVDYFFVVTRGGTMYLIPFDVTGGRRSLTLDDKYAAFVVM